MSYEAVPARFVHAIGWKAVATVWWGVCPADERGASHVIRHEIASGSGEPPVGAIAGTTEWMPSAGNVCQRCGEAFYQLPELEIDHAGAVRRTWDTESGELEPGCLYWKDWTHRGGGQRIACPDWEAGWENCTGRHLMGVLPNGHHWDIDGRASNCGSPNDRTHRCWIRHGDPETEPITVDKNGSTCAAGAGSIQSSDYHGFLQNGVFTAG